MEEITLQVQPETGRATAESIKNTAYSLLGIAGVGLALSPAIASALPTETSVLTDSMKAPYCDYPNNYYPGLCGVPKQTATDTCATQAAEDNNPSSSGLKARYIDGEYKLSFAEDPMGGCGKYAGKRDVSYSRQLRKGLTGLFVTTGKTVTVTANNEFKVRKTTKEAIQCLPTLAGSAVRELVKVNWIPKSGWGKDPTTVEYTNAPIVWSYSSKPQTVCK